MGVVVSGLAADAVDRLLTWSGGEVLRVGHGVSGGEYDSYYGGQVSRRVMRRLAGAGLVSRSGLEADRLQQVLAPYAPGVAGLSVDEFVGWWVGECVAGLDVRAGVRAGVAECEPEPEPEPEPEDCVAGGTVGVSGPVGGGVIPVWAGEWVARTVHGPKAEFLAELCGWWWCGGCEPVTPVAGWGVKCRDKFLRRAGRSR